jgi:hypothetical protein
MTALLLVIAVPVAASDTPATIVGQLENPLHGTPVIAVLDPLPAVMAAMEPGDTVTPVTLASAIPDSAGRFRLWIDPIDHRLPHGDGFVNVVVMHGLGLTHHELVVTLDLATAELIPTVDVGTVSNTPNGDPVLALASPLDELDKLLQGCNMKLVKTHKNVPQTTFVTGTNASGVALSALIKQSHTTEAGWAVNKGSGWAAGSGRYSRTTSSSATREWLESQMPDYGNTYTLRLTADHNEYTRSFRCNDRVTRPLNPTGSLWPAKTSKLTLKHCAPLGSKTTHASGSGTSWSNGVKLSSFGFGIDVSSKTDFAEIASVTYRPTVSGRWLCGYAAKPGPGAGHMVADSADRG